MAKTELFVFITSMASNFAAEILISFIRVKPQTLLAFLCNMKHMHLRPIPKMATAIFLVPQVLELSLLIKR